jgi:nicotinamide mononucleotide (NMN) deamidase PncC
MNTVCEHHLFEGDRASVREQAADAALKLMIKMIGEEYNI